jgi:translation initiation factor 3 subunit L
MAEDPHVDSDDSNYDDADEKAKKRDIIPDKVDHFLGRLKDCVENRKVNEIHVLYDEEFNALTDKHYKNPNSKWPNAIDVAEALGIESPKNSLFIILYKDLYYRHIFLKNQQTYEDRKGTWENYCKLLNLFVDDMESGQTLSIGLPAQWLWDILDEFVYQYETYTRFMNKTLKRQDDAEIQKLRENPDVFDTTKVLELLLKLVRSSKVEAWLKNPDSGITGGAHTDELVRHAGYFSIMQLLRMNSMLGDYRTALQTIDCVDFNAEVPLFYKIPACHITLFYYMGFGYLMMRRYVDAIRTFSSILVFLSKTSGVNQMSFQYEFMVKRQDQMYNLLLICQSLCPQTLDESVEKHIRDKLLEKQARLQRGEELCFTELFNYACPKFVSAAAPDFGNLESFNANEAQSRQQSFFLQEVKQQQALPKIGAYMKLYTSLKTSKLANLCEMDEEGLRDQLMCVMHKTRQPVNVGGPPLSGELQPCSEVEFYLDGDMVHINSHKPVRPHADVFLEQILKFQELLRKMENN